MVKRIAFRPYAYVAFALIILISCWESNRTHAALIDPGIPEQAIRLRILANSDLPNDQLVKMALRDEVLVRMDEWVGEPERLEEARANLLDRLPEVERLVGDVLDRLNYNYTYKVELGNVPFPAKMFGNKLYPAGEYEALRITLGSGEGQNWWCVLFPPLCFVDATGGAAVAKADSASASAAIADTVSDDGASPEVKFFLWELLVDIVDFVKGLFV